MPGFFESNGYTKTQRAALFFMACTPLRVYIAYLIYTHSHKKEVLGATALITFAMGVTYLRKNDQVWWNRRVHSYIMFIAFIYSILLYMNKVYDAKILFNILVLDVLFGIVSYLNKPK